MLSGFDSWKDYLASQCPCAHQWYSIGGNENDVNVVLEQYDFIVIKERFTESVVAMFVTLGLPLEGMFYVKTNVNTVRQETEIPEHELLQLERRYLPRDLELYNAAVERLDRVIRTMTPHYKRQYEYGLDLMSRFFRECSSCGGSVLEPWTECHSTCRNRLLI